MTGAALGDRFGRRNLYAAGLALFTLASAGCALAPSVEWLIAARAVQGAGSALLMSIGLALLGSAFPPERRGAAIGIFSAITGLAVASGPLVGGAVVQGISWEWIFWLNVPIGLVAVPLVLSRIGESFGSEIALDIPGSCSCRVRPSASSGGSCGRTTRAGEPRDRRRARAGRAARRGLRRVGAARPCADAADAALPLARVLGGQRRDLLHLRLAVRRRLLLRAASADEPRLHRSARDSACFPGPRRSSPWLRSRARWPTGSASGRSWSPGCCSRPSASAGSR